MIQNLARPLPLTRRLVTCLLMTVVAAVSHAQQKELTYKTDTDLLYREAGELTDYMRERCRLDVYYPTNVEKPFSTIVWFHGGGLRGGNKFVPDQLRDRGVAVVAVNYRLYPKVKVPDCIRDAAASVAWTFRNIDKYGGSSDAIFVSGHSAGGYLTSMLGIDKRWLSAHDIDADEIAGLIPFSGHTITHFSVRHERGLENTVPVVDELAPLYHVRNDSPPMLLITGDRERELLGRYEENAYFWRMMKVVGHPDVTLYEMDGFNHGTMSAPAHLQLLRFASRVRGSN